MIRTRTDIRAALTAALALAATTAHAGEILVAETSEGSLSLLDVVHDDELDGKQGKQFMVLIRMNEETPLPTDAVAVVKGVDKFRVQTLHIFAQCDQPPAIQLLSSDYLSTEIDKVAESSDRRGTALITTEGSVGAQLFRKACELAARPGKARVGEGN